MSASLEKVSIIPAEAAPVPATVTPMNMLAQLIERGGDINVIEKMMGLSERWEATQNRKAFDEAMAAAKAEIPTITKNREVDFTSQKGRTNYRYEDLGEIARTIGPILARYGLSYRYRATSQINEPVSVTCIVSHKAGHFEEITLSAGRDESGNKNSIQAIGSTLTYLQRMTLKAALGLAVSNDDDGKAAAAPIDTITQEEADAIRERIEVVGADRKKFLTFFRIETVEALPTMQHAAAQDMLTRFAEQKATKA